MTMHHNEGHSTAKTWAQLSLMTAVLLPDADRKRTHQGSIAELSALRKPDDKK